MYQDRELIKNVNKFIGDNLKYIEQADIDDFISLIADYLYTVLTVNVDERNTNLNFKNMNTKKVFDFGINCINQGISSDVIEAVLPFISYNIIQDKQLPNQEILEINLLEKLILIIQKADVEQFLLFINHLCSSDTYSVINYKFSQLKNN
jgi:hypothetical protein